MGYSFLRESSVCGPDEQPCEHTDCAEIIKMSVTMCFYCKQPIGWDRGFYRLDSGILVHSACHIDAIEKDDINENGHGFHTPRGDWPDRERIE